MYVIANVVPAILTKKLLRNGVSSNLLVNFSFIIGFSTLAPALFLQQSPVEFATSLWNLPFKYHLGVIFMAVLSGNIAYGLYAKAQKTIEIGDASIFAYLYPLFSTPLAVLWLRETITLPFIVGALIIAIGVFVAEYKSNPQSKISK